MDRISRHSQGVEGVRSGDRRIGSLLFADDVVLLASSDCDLQLSLDRFAAECEAAGMRISTSKSESMVLNRKRVECTLRFGDVVMFFEEEGRRHRIAFNSFYLFRFWSIIYEAKGEELYHSCVERLLAGYLIDTLPIEFLPSPACVCLMVPGQAWPL
ncbi:hypothetical protein N1851_034531 [Merluccius polli]|uniref:Reverse transcriptase domain-containing protein n=1 Tax=Merluccius polli TaxID=89951 RepID=A0AA47LZP1_MERPO|nr:hypothetical protein N1851_034531 [Merluccius polli]